VVLRSYFDGANQADLSQHDRVVLATVSASPEQWDGFLKDWNEVLGKYDVAYLHVTDALTLNKPYSVDRGWSDTLVDDLILDCVRVAKRHAVLPSPIEGEFRPGIRAVTMTIFLEDYKRARAANSLLPNSVYDLCISEMLGFVFRWGGKVGAEQHHFYFDQGEPFRGHVVDRTIDRVKASVPAFNSVVVNAKANMRSTPGLQLADLFAWCISHNDHPDKRLWHRALNDLPAAPSWVSVYLDEKYLANPIPGALEKVAAWHLPRRGMRPL
jgi:hypothetical protein